MTPPPRKKPAAAVTAKKTKVGKGKVGKKSVQPRRPTLPKDRRPTHYWGGRIYDDGMRLRCYVRATDKVEKSFAYHTHDARLFAWQRALDCIEMDKRPRDV